MRYVAQILGDTETETRSTIQGQRTNSTQLSTTRVNLVPAHALRQMQPGEALLVHATLPPAHVRTIPYYRPVRALRRRW